MALQCLVIDGYIPMTDFCWEYANALLQKLISLQKEGRLFQTEAPEEAQQEETAFKTLSPIGIEVMGKLQNQFPSLFTSSCLANTNEIDTWTATAQELLDIFVEKE